jgi:hypothetical protein
MRLFLDPSPSLEVFSQDLQTIISVEGENPPEVFVRDGLPRPDRHLLLGLVQAVSIAVEERDPESVVFMESCSIRIERAGLLKDLAPSLLIVRAEDGSVGALAIEDPAEARRRARKVVRWFTGTIRLDVP